jgi:phage major head subunit gpT-like protein
MFINKGNLTNLFTGFNGAFNKGFEGAKTAWPSVAMKTTSTTGREAYGWLAQFPGMREWVGDRVIKSLQANGYLIENKDFESTIAVGRNTIEDDQYGIFSPMFEEMGRAAAEHPDRLIFDLLAAGFTSACYDGQYFFDTDHPIIKDEVTVSVANTDGGAGTPWFLLDTTRALRPLIYQERRPFNLVKKDNETDDNVFMRKEYIYGVDSRGGVGFGMWQMAWGSKQTLDAAHYETARIALSDMVGDEGRKLGVRPNLLVVPTSLEGKAREIVGNQLNADGGSNKWHGTAEILVVPWL